MNISETAALLSVIKTAYPNSRFDANEQTLLLWHEMLADIPAEIATLAVKSMVATLKFPPSIADVREAVSRNERELRGYMTAGEAWDAVRRAISNYGYYQPEKARESLGERLWKAVGMAGGWTLLCTTDEVTTVSAQFERRYNAMVEQETYHMQVPETVMLQLRELAAQRLPDPVKAKALALLGDAR